MKKEKFDPYEELELDKDASTEEVRKKYRKRAKTAHPDRGGDRAEWDRLHRALVVLSDPKRRRHYDLTGEIDDRPVDRIRAAALGIIDGMIEGICAEYVKSNFDFRKDPSRVPLLEIIDRQLQQDIATAASSLRTGEMHIAFLKNFITRFTRKATDGEDTIKRMIEAKLDRVMLEKKRLEEVMEIRNVAREVLKEYAFSHDMPPQQTFAMATATTGTWRT